MSGIVNHVGSKSGTLERHAGQWKLLAETNLDGYGATNVSYYIGKGMRKGIFLKYRIDLSALRTNTGTEEELWLRWSSVTDATVGWSTNGYYSGRWSMNSGSGTTGTFAAEQALSEMRIAYLNGASGEHGHSHTRIEFTNVGLLGAHTDVTAYPGVWTYSVGYVHSSSQTGYGGVTCMGQNNNPTYTGITASGRELTCIQFGATNNLNKGYSRLYGLCK